MQKSAVISAPSVTIRNMQPSDIPVVSKLAAHIWRTHYVPDVVTAEQIEYMLPMTCSEASIEKAFKEKKQRFWLLYADESLTGYVACEPKGQGAWFIDKLYVDTAEHGKGLGSLLLSHLERELSPTQTTLRVNRKNHKAINFYFKHGFVIYGLDALDIGGGFVMDDFLMKKIR